MKNVPEQIQTSQSIRPSGLSTQVVDFSMPALENVFELPSLIIVV